MDVSYCAYYYIDAELGSGIINKQKFIGLGLSESLKQ